MIQSFRHSFSLVFCCVCVVFFSVLIYIFLIWFLIKKIHLQKKKYKSSVRPLGFVPATIEPKSRANPVLRLCLPLALIDKDFLSKGCLCKSHVLCFFTHCIGCSAALETNSIWNFSTSLLSFFTRLSHTRDRRLASKIPLSTLVAVDWLSSFGSVRRRCSKALRKQPMEESKPQRRNGPAS